MTIWEISEKADYIAQRHRRLQDQWHIYCNSLVQGITLSKARLHHAMSCAPERDLCFVLFEHFRIYVALADGFNSHTIEYYVETKDGEDKQLIAQAQLDIDGKVDERVNNRDREQVLEHYLEKTLIRDVALRHVMNVLGMGVSISVENDISTACFRQK
ncbi:transcriptional regulator [Salmonella enterica subsp. enterica serovar Typhimurium]|nr:transcriptional regulator [Salmonella enterica subsp. enterica serovar Typhimurium]